MFRVTNCCLCTEVRPCSTPDDPLLTHPWSRTYARLLRRLDFLVVLLSIGLFALSFHFVKDLRVRSDFKEMLPEKYRSVIEFNNIEKRVHSVGNLILLVGDAPWEAMKRFIDDFAPRAAAELGAEVSNVEVNVKDVADFYDHNKYLFIDLPDLQEIHDRLKRKIDYEKLKRTNLYIEFGDEAPELRRLRHRAEVQEEGGQLPRLQGRLLHDPGCDAGRGDPEAPLRRHQRGVRGKADGSHPRADRDHGPGEVRPEPQVRVRRPLPEDGDGVQVADRRHPEDHACSAWCWWAAWSSSTTAAFRPCILVTITVTQGVLAALALGYLFIGYLTSQTAFLGSIIVGNGINYSLIFMSRYLEERRDKGRGIVDAIAVTISQTWKPTLVAATDHQRLLRRADDDRHPRLQPVRVHRRHRHGHLLALHLLLPPQLALAGRADLGDEGERWEAHEVKYWLLDPFARLLVTRYRDILKVSAALSVLAVVAVAWYLPNSLEYNFEKMRFKPVKEKGDQWEPGARDKINEIFGQSTTPSVVLADRADQSDPICDEIRRKSGPEGDTNLLDDCKTLPGLVPRDQPAKMEILASMRQMLSSSSLNFLNEEQKKEVNKFLAEINLRPVVAADIPATITRNFEEVDGSAGKIVYVYPKPTANLWNGRELIRFADLIREVDLPGGEKIYSSGEPVIFADLLNVVVREGPLVTLFSFVLVLVVIAINFRASRESGIVMGSLMLGILWMVASLPLFGIKLNFFNFIILPLTFGIGVDYAVNMVMRIRQEGPEGVAHAIRHTGPAVILCSLTTIIGYFVLTAANNQALATFGIAAVIGEITCITAAMISLPAFITWRERRAEARKAASEAEPCGRNSCGAERAMES